MDGKVLFDDWAEGSHHVGSVESAQGVREEKRASAIGLLGAFVLGSKQEARGIDPRRCLGPEDEWQSREKPGQASGQ